MNIKTHKNVIKKSVVILVLGLIIILSFLIFNKIQQIEKVKDQIQLMRDFELTDVKNFNRITKDDLFSDRSTLFIFFNSQCDFCIYELQELNDCIEKFKNNNIVLFSDEGPDVIMQFISGYNFFSCNNFFVGRNSYQNLADYFGELVPPTCLIYDTNKHLICKYKGSVTMETLINSLEKRKTHNGKI